MKRAYTVRRSRAAGWARLCGGLAVPVLVLAALGARVGLIPGAALLAVLAVGFVLALMAVGIAVYALTDIWTSGAEGAGVAIAGVVYALPALALLGLVAAGAIMYPRLSDITTDAENPPELIASGSMGSGPDGGDIARQREAYPDIVTRSYPLPLGEVYTAAREIIEERGWTIIRESRPTVMPVTSRQETAAAQVGETSELIRALARKKIMTQSRGVSAGEASEPGSEPSAGRRGNVAALEATAQTPVFGFRDAVVIRLRGSAEGTEVDMRSASKTGEHDLGQNARRIRSFFEELDEALQPPGASGIASADR